MLGVSIVPVYMILRLDFGTVLTVLYLFPILFELKFYMHGHLGKSFV